MAAPVPATVPLALQMAILQNQKQAGSAGLSFQGVSQAPFTPKGGDVHQQQVALETLLAIERLRRSQQQQQQQHQMAAAGLLTQFAQQHAAIGSLQQNPAAQQLQQLQQLQKLQQAQIQLQQHHTAQGEALAGAGVGAGSSGAANPVLQQLWEQQQRAVLLAMLQQQQQKNLQQLLSTVAISSPAARSAAARAAAASNAFPPSGTLSPDSGSSTSSPFTSGTQTPLSGASSPVGGLQSPSRPSSPRAGVSSMSAPSSSAPSPRSSSRPLVHFAADLGAKASSSAGTSPQKASVICGLRSPSTPLCGANPTAAAVAAATIAAAAAKAGAIGNSGSKDHPNSNRSSPKGVHEFDFSWADGEGTPYTSPRNGVLGNGAEGVMEGGLDLPSEEEFESHLFGVQLSFM